MSDFDSVAQDSLTNRMRSELSCFEPECLLKLQVHAGSVRIAAQLTVPHTVQGARNSATLTAVSTAAAALTASASALSSALGVSVTAVFAPVIKPSVTVPLVIAASPPFPPLPIGPPASPSPTSLTGEAAGVFSLVDCAVPADVRFTDFERWELELAAEVQPAVASQPIRGALAAISEAACQSDVHLVWLSQKHIEAFIYGLPLGRSPSFLQSAKRAERLERWVRRHHPDPDSPVVLPGTNVSVVSCEWDRSVFYHFHISLLAPAEYPLELVACWVGPAISTLAAVAVALFMHGATSSRPHFAGLLNGIARLPALLLGKRLTRLGIGIQVSVVALYGALHFWHEVRLIG